MNSPDSACGPFLSDVSISDLSYNGTSPALAVTNPEPKLCAPPEYEGVPLFESGDGDIQISVNGTYFETHKYLIKRFRGLKLLLDKQPLEISIKRNDVSADDFCEMFKVLYASVVMGPFIFDCNTLISTLRVATTYEYHSLRDFCIQYLETLELDAVKRIDIARKFHLPSWEGPAYHELAMRDEPITREEANIIGLDAFVNIAEMREKEQRRRGKEIDAISREQDARTSFPAPPAGELLMQDTTIGNGPQEDGPHEVPTCIHPPQSDQQVTKDIVTRVDNNGAEIGPSFLNVELSGVYDRKPPYGHGIEMPGCECRFINNGRTEDRKCAALPCTISAFKSIQVQQLAMNPFLTLNCP
ncbi:hypothetical protein OPQ81_010283 [Rhizoctonia solani]|nr:hypothetical protein OPQ81_010283 [Rhizoctonia solani]